MSVLAKNIVFGHFFTHKSNLHSFRWKITYKTFSKVQKWLRYGHFGQKLDFSAKFLFLSLWASQANTEAKNLHGTTVVIREQLKLRSKKIEIYIQKDFWHLAKLAKMSVLAKNIVFGHFFTHKSNLHSFRWKITYKTFSKVKKWLRYGHFGQKLDFSAKFLVFVTVSLTSKYRS